MLEPAANDSAFNDEGAAKEKANEKPRLTGWAAFFSWTWLPFSVLAGKYLFGVDSAFGYGVLFSVTVLFLMFTAFVFRVARERPLAFLLGLCFWNSI